MQQSQSSRTLNNFILAKKIQHIKPVLCDQANQQVLLPTHLILYSFHSFALFITFSYSNFYKIYLLFAFLSGIFTKIYLLSTPNGFPNRDLAIFSIFLISAISYCSFLKKISFLFCIYSIYALIPLFPISSNFTYWVTMYLFPLTSKYSIRFFWVWLIFLLFLTIDVRYEQPPAREQSTTEP